MPWQVNSRWSSTLLKQSQISATLIKYFLSLLAQNWCAHVSTLCIVASVLWYCWMDLLTCKNRLPYNLYCVGGDVKHCSIQSNLCVVFVDIFTDNPWRMNQKKLSLLFKQTLSSYTVVDSDDCARAKWCRFQIGPSLSNPISTNDLNSD